MVHLLDTMLLDILDMVCLLDSLGMQVLSMVHSLGMMFLDILYMKGLGIAGMVQWLGILGTVHM